MVYVYIFLGALATGGLVFWLTLRSEGSETQSVPLDGDGFLPLPPSAGESGDRARDPADDQAGDPTGLPAGVYVPIVADRRSWQTRVAGLLGLLIMVSLAAAALAFALYEAGSLIARLLSDYASSTR